MRALDGMVARSWVRLLPGVAGAVLGLIVTSSRPPVTATAFTATVGRGPQANGVGVAVGIGVGVGGVVGDGVGVEVKVGVGVSEGPSLITKASTKSPLHV